MIGDFMTGAGREFILDALVRANLLTKTSGNGLLEYLRAAA